MSSSDTVTGIEKWKRWEKTFTSSKTYSNPFLNHDLKVTYTSPTGETYSSYGFWDGGTTFKIRFMFNEIGKWNWKTTFSDTENIGLHNRSGNVNVTAYSGDNPLYKHGYLKVSDNKRYLTHWDDTPFLWIADTAWTAYIYATDPEWESYIDNRSSKKITAILMSSCCITNNENSSDAEGNVFFPGTSPLQINPTAWRNLEDKIQYASDNGILMMIVGLINGRVMEKAEAHEVEAFIKMLSARIAGNHVILSPTQDWGHGNLDMHHMAGTKIKEALPFHLITQHTPRGTARIPGAHGKMATGAEWALHFYHDSYLDFSGIQTGHGASLPDSTPLDSDDAMDIVAKDHIQWIDRVYAEEPPKPVIISEGMYELNEGTDGVENSREMVRRQGYWSFLNGAYGYSSSCHAIWGWGNVDINWAKPRIECPSVSEGIDYVYATHLKYMYDFFSSIEWSRLEPNHENLIKNQVDNYRQKMMLAKSDDGSLAVAYLPDNNRIEIDMNEFPSAMKAKWYRTTSGTYQNEPGLAMNKGTYTFHKPDGWQDSVLLLQKAGDIDGNRDR